MLNYIWLLLIAVAVIVAGFTHNMELLTDTVLSSAKSSVGIAFDLIGIMTLWLGMMKIAEEAGFIRFLARLVRPIAKFLFPDVPQDHPAIGAVTLNLSANWLGLGNAATPFGIKAMEELQTLNPDKDTATNAQIMLLGLNTASITLIPMTMIGVRVGLNSVNPVDIIFTIIFSSLMATLAVIFVVKLFIHLGSGKGIGALKNYTIAVAGIAGLGAFIYFTGIGRALLFIMNSEAFKHSITSFSYWVIPTLLLLIPFVAILKKLPIYELFIEGAKEGFQVAVRIIPYLVAILVAVGMFRASGAMGVLVKILAPLTDLIGMPAEILPAALMRPLSGSGTLGLVTELMQTHGPDSFIGNLGSTLYGCTETTFYVIAVYFGAVNIKNTRFAVAAGLIADVVGVLAALYICRILFL